ncbi:MAG: hypothetical protein JOY54_08090 [Acidobacteriaceae bacterium]|nr:hypothetical protein [Acidobacteriaceae bacterium]
MCDDATTKLYDCGNWAVTASWQVPANAVLGFYIAQPYNASTGGASQITFIVRNDTSHSDILFQASDETWQAYNDYGGHSLYGELGTWHLPDRAYKVSYNRPFDTRNLEAATWFMNAEYPMIRWLEANGFFSGNEVFWKTRWENSIDGTNTAYRTLVCYKETLANSIIDPLDPPTWTGTSADPRFSPPADGGLPQNALTGTLFQVNGPGPDNDLLSIEVPAQFAPMRLWRNTSVASLSPGQTAVLVAGSLGYEWDADVDNGFRPAGLFDLSSATYPLTEDLLLDYGSTYGAGTATHSLTMYRAPSRALVFGAGTVQWSWGLDTFHDGASEPTDIRIQQATLNLFADMGVQPTTRQSGLVPATMSTDTTPPTSTVMYPLTGTTIPFGDAVTITGTASDSGGGVVTAVEVSIDGGKTWHRATRTTNWSYTFTALTRGSVTIQSRGVDDSANLETPGPGSTITVLGQAISIDATASDDGQTAGPTISTSGFSTSQTNELLLAFITTDYLSGTNTTVTNVSGGGLTWAPVVRTNTQSGDAEIWRALSPSPLSNVKIMATLSQSVVASITVMSFSGIDTSGSNGSGAIGAVVSSHAKSGAPTGTIVTTRNGSWVFGVGNDFDNAIARSPAAGQTIVHQLLTTTGDTYWVQMQNAIIPQSGTSVTIGDTAPTSDQYNLSMVEILPAPAPTYSVSGSIGPSSAIAGTTIGLTGSATASVAPDSSGNFVFSNLNNGTYTITASNTGFTFAPTNQVVTIGGGNISDVDFTGTPVPTYTISGAITPGTAGAGAPVDGSGQRRERRKYNDYRRWMR